MTILRGWEEIAGPVILSREDGEGSQDAQPKILRYAQDDGAVRMNGVHPGRRHGQH